MFSKNEKLPEVKKRLSDNAEMALDKLAQTTDEVREALQKSKKKFKESDECTQGKILAGIIGASVLIGVIVMLGIKKKHQKDQD